MFKLLKKTEKKFLIISFLITLSLIGSFFVFSYTKASYAVISFTEVGAHTWVVPEGAISADILVVAGGGGGGYRHGAGGGAGGLIFKENYSLTPGNTITINVGAGGKGSTGATAATRSTNGADSSFGPLVAVGGGAGGQWDTYKNGSSGGSGGGSAAYYNASGVVSQGSAGGSFVAYKHGGGGGAGEVGQNGTSTSNGSGGDGLYYGNVFGDNYGDNGWFAGGGGGGGHNPAALDRGLGGLGGGGNGGTPNTFQDGNNGLPNTGGGGGGASAISGGTNKGGSGGSGVVIIKYKLRAGAAEGATINSGLIGYWTLNESDYNNTNNRVTDKGPFENHGINSGAAFAADRFEKEDRAMSFASNNLLSFNNSNSFNLDSFSVSMWVYHRSYSYPRTFAPIKKSNPNCYVSGGRGWDFGHTFSSSGVDVCLSDGTNVYRGGLIFNPGSKPNDLLNKWTHITYVVDRSDSKVRAYINGVKQDYEISINPSLGSIANSGDLVIGSLYGWYLDGLLDDVRIYNRALSELEIKSLHDSYSPKTTTGSLQRGLVLDMPLKLKYTKSETVGSQIMTDRTPYSHDGQNYGAIITNEGAAFDGNDYISIGSGSNYFPLPLFSFCSWISSPGLAPEMTVNGIFTLTYGLRFTLNASGNFSTSIDNGSTFVTINDTANLHDNEFHHLCLTYDGVDRHMFVDGVKKISAPTVWSGISRWPTNGARIGHDINHPARYSFNGKISNFLIYNRALSEDEIKTLYNRGRSDAGIIFQTEN